ncbi:MAG: alpha/beta fold hydrolase [Alphaproteobacteria bacterium]|nr:alpha/beta fold hydrolase [Alphaproteobacteria bacterium]
MTLARIPADWPWRDASEIVSAGGVSWHVQRFGSGPALLLIHGAGASTHSFEHLARALASEFTIVMADLPGHGFSGPMEAPELPLVAQALGALLARIGVAPAIAAGHSAGAAVALRMTLDGLIRPRALIGFAPALQPYGGAADGLASKMARLAMLNPLTPRLVAMRANDQSIARLMARTGSHLDASGVALYRQLLRQPGHIAGTLRLMAHWKLRPLLADLCRVTASVTVVLGENDRATPAQDAWAAARRIPGCQAIRLPGLGHLAHEEDPVRAAGIIRLAAQAAGLDTRVREPAHRLAGGN